MIQIPGQHVPPVKNRSSKHLYLLTKVKPAVRSASTAMLQEWSKGNGPGVHKEIKRRADKGRGKTAPKGA